MLAHDRLLDPADRLLRGSSCPSRRASRDSVAVPRAGVCAGESPPTKDSNSASRPTPLHHPGVAAATLRAWTHGKIRPPANGSVCFVSDSLTETSTSTPPASARAPAATAAAHRFRLARALCRTNSTPAVPDLFAQAHTGPSPDTLEIALRRRVCAVQAAVRITRTPCNHDPVSTAPRQPASLPSTYDSVYSRWLASLEDPITYQFAVLIELGHRDVAQLVPAEPKRGEQAH